jgi:deoxyribonuclease-4
MIRFGPAGLGGVKDAVSNLESYSKLGLRACEIAFTYGIYIKKKEDAEKIGEAARKFGIKLSIHAPYWINLNSNDNKKIQKSKERILKCCEVGTWLGAYAVVFHPGYYGKKGKKETYENIKKEIIDLQKEIKKNNYSVKLAPETTGKLNVFGSVDEISRLSEETGCIFCIDFAHILARYKTYNFKEVLEKFKRHKDLHVHFSGIEYGEKGERHHKITAENEIKKLLENLPKDKKIIIINESPMPVNDSILSLNLYSKKHKSKYYSPLV